MTAHLEFPEGFDDFAWEVEAKGWLQGSIARIGRQRYALTFYDLARLTQDVKDAVERDAVFLECNLVVVPAVTRVHMQAAVELIARTGRHSELVPEP